MFSALSRLREGSKKTDRPRLSVVYVAITPRFCFKNAKIARMAVLFCRQKSSAAKPRRSNSRTAAAQVRHLRHDPNPGTFYRSGSFSAEIG
jgi:hypothetical protein